MKIFQTSDLHLGCRRLGGRLPDTDLVEAFNFIASEAINAKADAFLIVGDLFDKPQVEPRHLRQAQQVLAKLKQANIPVIAVEGNHDRISLSLSNTTWLHYLAEDSLVILLSTVFGSDGPYMSAWNSTDKSGSFFDLCGIRFVGLGYLGAATPYKVRELVSRLEIGQHYVLLLHAGPDYFVGEGGGLSTNDLALIRSRVTYLALGHIHKPMIYANWACNAGSPENCDLREANYDLNRHGAIIERGYAIIDIDTSKQGASKVNISTHSNPRRPIHRITLDCTSFGKKLKDGAATLIRTASALIRTKNLDTTAVIDLKLTGKMNLNRVALDQTIAESEIEKNADVTAVAIDPTNLVLDSTTRYRTMDQICPNRKDLENIAILQLLTNHHLFGLDDVDQDLVTLLQEIKDGIGAHWSTEKIAEHFHKSYLVDRILTSNTVEH